MATKNDDKLNIRCTFCGKAQEEVQRIIAGPGVYICNECVELCHEIIEEDNEAEAVDLRAENFQILYGGLPNDIEQGLAALGNAHGVVPAIQGAGEG